MRRAESLERIRAGEVWDLLVIGGGATGLGTAVDAASRGYRTLLLEAHDFAEGTSSRSTKLIHGGVRYLAQGNVPLVREALHERGLLLRNAPHLVHRRDFVVPAYHLWQLPYYGAGLWLYDRLAGESRPGPLAVGLAGGDAGARPDALPAGLRGGILYTDGQFDDARLAIALARTRGRPRRRRAESYGGQRADQARRPDHRRRGARRGDRRDVRDRRPGPWSMPPGSSPTRSAGSTSRRLRR